MTKTPRSPRRLRCIAAAIIVLTSVVAAAPPTAAAEGDPVGYWLLGQNGTVFSCGDPAQACSHGPSGSVQHFGDVFGVVGTPSPKPGDPTSDDFNDASLDGALWTEAGNTLGGATFSYPGLQAVLTVPAGTSEYQPWTSGNRAPTLRQNVSDGDLDMVVVFGSTPSSRFQMQGILVADAVNDFLRFDVHWNGTQMRAFAADPRNSATPLLDVTVPSPAHARYLRVTRTGNTWTHQTSPNGVEWTTNGSFSRPMVVTGMGPFIGNARTGGGGSMAPAYTGIIDYFGTLPIPAGAIGGAQASVGATAVAMTPTATGDGYLILMSDGAVVVRGDARHYGDLRDPGPAGILAPGERGTAISLTDSGAGYWIFTNLGRAVVFGDASHHGDLPGLSIVPDEDVVASAAVAGGGYFMLGADGGVFAFGSATFAGSIPQILPGVTLDCEIVGLVPTPSGDGYWLVGCDGGVFAFGGAGFVGSIPEILPGVPLAAPVNGMVAYGGGYLMVASDGGAFNFGAPFFGSLGATDQGTDIVAIAPAT